MVTVVLPDTEMETAEAETVTVPSYPPVVVRRPELLMVALPVPLLQDQTIWLVITRVDPNPSKFLWQ